MARRPRFNEEESTLLGFARAKKLGGMTGFAFSYLTLGICVAAAGLYYDIRLMTAAGLIVLVLGRWQELESDRHSGRIWATVVGKFDSAIDKYEEELE